jgi:hypothetical protein
MMSDRKRKISECRVLDVPVQRIIVAFKDEKAAMQALDMLMQ